MKKRKVSNQHAGLTFDNDTLKFWKQFSQEHKNASLLLLPQL